MGRRYLYCKGGGPNGIGEKGRIIEGEDFPVLGIDRRSSQRPIGMGEGTVVRERKKKRATPGLLEKKNWESSGFSRGEREKKER